VRKTIVPVSADGHDAIASAHNDYDALEVKANYYAMIDQIDDQFGRLMQTLRDSGQLENTIVVYMSDHGEMLGDHGLILKGWPVLRRSGAGAFDHVLAGNSPADWQAKPWWKRLTWRPPSWPPAGWRYPPTCKAGSRLPLLTGQTDPHRHKSAVVSEYRDAMGGHADHSHASMVFDGRYKSVFYHGHDLAELFDSVEDPEEYDNLWLHRQRGRSWHNCAAT